MNNKEFELYKEAYANKLAGNSEKFDLMISYYEDSLARANKYCEDLFNDAMNKNGAERTDSDITLIKNAMNNRDNLVKKIEECKNMQKNIAERAKMNDFYERNIMFLQEELKNNPNNEYAKGEITKQRALYAQTLSYSNSLSADLFRESGLDFDALKADREKAAKEAGAEAEVSKPTFAFKENPDAPKKDNQERASVYPKFYENQKNEEVEVEEEKKNLEENAEAKDNEEIEAEEIESKKPTSVENKPGFVKKNISKILPKTKLQYGLIGAAVGAAGMSAILAPQWLVLVGMVGLASYVVKQLYDGRKGKTK